MRMMLFDGAGPAGAAVRPRRPLLRAALRLALRLGAVLLPALPAHATVAPLGLWEKTFRAELVARVTVVDGDDRLARMRVNEVLKGRYDGEDLKVVFRAENFSRKPWEERIVFEKGKRLILFLERFRKNGELQEEDRFALFRGYQGKEEVPAEGEDAYLQAIRRFIEIQSLPSQLARWEASRALLSEPNPLLVEAGFEQVLKFRLADEALVPVLLGHLDSPTVPFRQQAVRCFAQILDESSSDTRTLETEDHIRDLLVHKAMSDSAEEVRVESIKALEVKGDGNLLAALREIASRDPSQAVRYQAERAIYELENAPPRRN